MKRTSPEKLTDQLMGDLSRAIRLGGPVLATLRRQGYIISAKELDVLKPGWRRLNSGQSTISPKRKASFQKIVTAPGPIGPGLGGISPENAPIQAAPGDREGLLQTTGDPTA